MRSSVRQQLAPIAIGTAAGSVLNADRLATTSVVGKRTTVYFFQDMTLKFFGETGTGEPQNESLLIIK